MTAFPPNTLNQPSRWSDLQAQLQPEKLFPAMVAGGITGLIGVIRAISYAALIFSGSLAVHLNVGVGIAIFSSAAISIVVALNSSLPGMIATPLAAPTAVLAILAAAIAEELTAAGVEASGVVFTVVAAIAIGSLVTGACLLILGLCRWGNALQFIPYPVVGGFMAATGLLLVRGGLQVMSDLPADFAHLPQLLRFDVVCHWGVGLLVAIALLFFTKRYRHPLMMPAVLLASTACFYGGIWQSGLPLDEVRELGWLLGPFPEGNLWQPLTVDSLAYIHWPAIVHQSSTISLLVFVSLLSLVLTNGGIELALGRELDINQELRAIGLANLAAGLGSTMAGNQALPSTLLVHKMNAASRFSGLFKAIPCITVLFLGPAFLAYFPKPILGSLLLYLGLDLLWQWLYKIWFSLGGYDYLTILVTMATINRTGFIPGIGIGLVMIVLQFLYRCTRENPCNASNVASAQTHIPRNLEESMTWVDFKGFLFFGNAATLFDQVRSLMEPPTPGEAPKYIVLNFQSVLSLDASAILSFSKLLKYATDQNLTLVYDGLSDTLEQQLRRGQAIAPENKHCIHSKDFKDTVELLHSSTSDLNLIDVSPQ